MFNTFLYPWCSGVATILTSSFGVVGNLLSILVLTRQSMVSVSNHLLLFLCLSDLVFLLASLAMSPLIMCYYNLYPSVLFHAFDRICIFNSPAAYYHGPEWQLVVDILGRYLAIVNSSVNFVIYCLAGKQFRSVLVTLLHLKKETTVQNVA